MINSRTMRGRCKWHEWENFIQSFGGRPERLRRREDDNIQIYLLKNRTG
jgi:hypothetical protein